MFFSGLIIGLVGGMHCVLMCSPVVLALYPKRHWWDQLQYQSARVIMYVILGLIIGMAGNSLALIGLSRILSVSMGIVIILLTLSPFTRHRLYRVSISRGPVAYFRKLLASANGGRAWLAGMVNGLLPCGLVYVALTGSLALGNTSGAVIFMAGFGVGTVPWLSGAVVSSGFIPENFRRRASAMIPVLAVSVGLLFILRGLALDIPFISPALQSIGLPEQLTICR